MNANRPLQCAKILGISRLVLRMRLGAGQAAGAGLIERCAAASFQQRGLEWAKKENSHDQADDNETSGATTMKSVEAQVINSA